MWLSRFFDTVRKQPWRERDCASAALMKIHITLKITTYSKPRLNPRRAQNEVTCQRMLNFFSQKQNHA